MGKENYVIYDGANGNDREFVCRMSEEQAKAIEWFINALELDGCIEKASDYQGQII